MNKNGGWLDKGNLMAGAPIDHGGGFNTILEIVVRPNTTLQNRLVRWWLPVTSSLILRGTPRHLLSNVGLFNNKIKQHVTNQNVCTQVDNKLHLNLIKVDYQSNTEKQHATIYNRINNKKMG